MSVRAKMSCKSVISAGEGGGGTVELSPVTAGSRENDQFYKYTPGGQLLLSTINEEAFQQFTIGEEYYVDISPA